MFPPPGLLSRGPETASQFLAHVGEAGIDYVCCGDHVSFFGLGFDGLVQATALAMLHPALPVHVGVYRQTDHSLVRLYKLQNLSAGQHASVTWDGVSISREGLISTIQFR